MRNGFPRGRVRPVQSFLHRSQLGQRVDHGPLIFRVGNQSERVKAAPSADDAPPDGYFGAGRIQLISLIGNQDFNQSFVGEQPVR